MRPDEARTRLEAVRASVATAVVGRDAAVDQLLIGIVADGHLLLEDRPGLGKTLLARSLAQALGLTFRRIQFTSDLLPHDITGGEVYEAAQGTFRFRPGPIFTQVLLADEINRAPPKVQSALLEAMQEYQVTGDGGTRPLERPFLVLATQNPIELEGTYPLPEAQLDRFLMRIAVGYPTATEERAILARRRARRTDAVEVPKVLETSELLEVQASAEEIEVDPVVEGYAVDLVAATREDPRAELGASPRGSLALLKIARARALLDGRAFALPDDVKWGAQPSLAHRLLVKPEPWIRGIRGSDLVASALQRVAVPKRA